ncbi:SWIM zinc finger family protein [Deinococcus cellulosilyticus]|uniref:SWIM-type domain-containing protein n=1 Tax=Deinococcus cellulosilyticus (strain DSM 18568 / NBRC 106333 / KACC 11606 / 5516J-15) TaxID=1223518 RepID=A0A511N0Z8_DEIC1|nr:SWIM zinc finger family protein [Deinococcus cellulosilyticus]GEM46545.1 hypothetical protein DC3_21800 [Deinococcus cellulosilyticus NBRC 106333 = KACC 11606]
MFKFSTFPPRYSDFCQAFSDKTLQKARAILHKGDLELIELSRHTIMGNVMGSEGKYYTMSVESNGRFSCTCPAEVQPCKHVAALLLVVEGYDDGDQEPELSLEDHVANLDLSTAQELLLELAEIPKVRRLLMKYFRHAEPVVKRYTALDRLQEAVRAEQNIELLGSLGEEAFAELSALPPEKRAGWAWDMVLRLKTYEPDWETYDAYSEAGDAHWEDRVGDWTEILLTHWAEAQVELGQTEKALEQLEDFFENNAAAFGGLLHLAAQLPNGRAWITKRVQGSYREDEYMKAIIKRMGTPEEFEALLRQNLSSPYNHHELVEFLVEQNRLPEALDHAETSVREHVRRHQIQHLDPHLQAMLELLHHHRPAFEWEKALFFYQQNLDAYRALARWPEFTEERDALLKKVWNISAKLDMLQWDQDLAGLKALLKSHPNPEHAVRLKHLLPLEVKTLLKRHIEKSLEETSSRSIYQAAALWAREYQDLEAPEIFKPWLLALLDRYRKRPALQDEFKSLKARLQEQG